MKLKFSIRDILFVIVIPFRHQKCGYKGAMAIPKRLISQQTKWGQTELAMLGRWRDAEIARITGRPLGQVVAKRESLKIPAQKRSG